MLEAENIVPVLTKMLINTEVNLKWSWNDQTASPLKHLPKMKISLRRIIRGKKIKANLQVGSFSEVIISVWVTHYL